MHESIVFCSTCTMSSCRKFTFAISSPDEFLVELMSRRQQQSRCTLAAHILKARLCSVLHIELSLDQNSPLDNVQPLIIRSTSWSVSITVSSVLLKAIREKYSDFYYGVVAPWRVSAGPGGRPASPPLPMWGHSRVRRTKRRTDRTEDRYTLHFCFRVWIQLHFETRAAQT